MTICVLDASLAISWLFADERTPEGDAALTAVVGGGALVPALWSIEVANACVSAERRGRLSQAEVAQALVLVSQLPLSLAGEGWPPELRQVLDLARRHRLTAYDSLYLDLARRAHLPLATRDRKLLAAAQAEGVARFVP